MTPEEARTLLGWGADSRPIDQQVVSVYAEEILAGRWTFTLPAPPAPKDPKQETN